MHSCKRPPFCVTGSNWCLDKTGGDPTPFLTKENCICVEGICRLLLLKDFGWIFPTTSSCLHPLPGGVHIRALQQSTANISLSQQPYSAYPTWRPEAWLPLPCLVLAQQHSSLTQGPSPRCRHRGAAPQRGCPTVTKGSKGPQAQPCEQTTTGTLKDLGLHGLPCSLPLL